MNKIIMVLALLASLCFASTANATTGKIPTLTTKQVRHIKAGSKLIPHANLYPSEGGAIPPPYPCQRALDGIILVYGGEAWECFCPSPSTGICEWRISWEYDGAYFPDWYVLRPPNSTSLCTF